MASDRGPLHLGVVLEGAGSHPAAWRVPGARPADLFDGDRLVSLVQDAERGGLDFVVVDDGFGLQSSRSDRVRGRLDALLALARVAPATTSIGLIPVVTVTHTEPFHVSKNVATLDWVSHGRAGWKVALSETHEEADLFGRKPAVPAADLCEEAAEVIDVVRRLWDSWEDDAVIKDRATGRYLDRDKVHYVDFEGRFFKVRGPSITPRSPQAHPLVALDASSDETLRLGAARADLIFLDVADAETAAATRDAIRARVRGVSRDPDTVAVMATVDVLLASDGAAARDERRRLDDLAGGDVRTGALDFVGTAGGFADLVEEWADSGAVDGFVVRPARLPSDLARLVDEVVPQLCERGLFRAAYEGRTLRDRFGLERPVNRYAVKA
jgi:alkanesulfonate monooxygenase SsuD/methylene tetrahydromethanopterin reductase-like flavin-dependent oxidoreductase (luciferase family)